MASKAKSRYSQLGSDGSRKVVGIGDPSLSPQKSPIRFERNGQQLLAIHGETQTNASLWLEFSGICDFLKQAFLSWGPGVSSRTFKGGVFALNEGLLSYAKESGNPSEITLDTLDPRWLSEFRKWLARRGPEKAPILSEGTQAKRWGIAKILFSHMKKAPAANARLNPEVSFSGKSYHGRRSDANPIEALDEPTSKKILLACLQEARSTMEEVRSAWKSIELAKTNPERADDLSKDRLLYSECHGGEFPTYTWLLNNDRDLWNQLSLGRANSLKSLRKPFMPEARDVVPFVILLAFHTGFNPDTIRSLRLSDIDWPDGFGSKRIRFSPNKARSGRRQIRSFALGDPLGPGAIVNFLIRWGERMRSIAPAEDKDLLFAMVYPSDHSGSGFARFAGFPNDGYSRWTWASSKFREDHSLPDFTLAQIRKSSLDLVHEITDGDIKAVAIAGGQRSTQTIDSHYTSDSARLRNSEKLGLAMATRERWVGSDGKSADPRKEPLSADKGAATPGFHCLDPFASPIPSEAKGRLCQAYGMCPSCPLAVSKRFDAHALARLMQLRKKILDSQTEMEPARWLAAWSPIAERLQSYWIPACSDEKSLLEAERLTLPALPPLE